MRDLWCGFFGKKGASMFFGVEGENGVSVVGSGLKKAFWLIKRLFSVFFLGVFFLGVCSFLGIHCKTLYVNRRDLVGP